MPLFGSIQIKSIGILKKKKKNIKNKKTNKKQKKKTKHKKKKLQQKNKNKKPKKTLHFIFGQASNISLFEKLI